MTLPTDYITVTGSVDLGGPSWGQARRAPFWRRLWFLVSAVPRYLKDGSVRFP